MTRVGRFAEGMLLYVPLAVGICFTLFPFYWLIVTSLKSNSETISKVVTFFPKHFVLSNFAAAWKELSFSLYFKNSLIVAICTILITLIFSITVGYGMTRFRFRGRMIFMLLLLCTQFIPGTMLLIPLFNIFKSLGIIGHLSSLVVTYATFQLPFNAILMSGFIAGIPYELEEAAMVDGCSRFRLLFSIIMPLLMPGIVTTAAFTFIHSWNEFLFALMFISNNSAFTLPVALYSLFGEYSVNYGSLAAASIIALVPAVILFGAIQKYLVRGILSGAVKG